MTQTRSLRAEALTSALALALAIFLALVAGSTRVTAQSAILHVLVQSSSGRRLALEAVPRQPAPAPGGGRRGVGGGQGRPDQLELMAWGGQGRRLDSEGNRMDGTNLTFELAGRCMTEPAPNAPPWVTLTPCAGAPTQRWRYAHLP